MSAIAVVGVNWGDEGKGRIVDYLAKDADYVIRYQGGNNAGHTVVNEFGTFKLHLIPSGVFYDSVTNILGPGTIIDLQALDDELTQLRNQNIKITNFWVSDRATICLPYNRQEDVWEEERLGANAYGSTKRGIAPAYGDRYLKKAIQVGELLYPEFLKPKVKDLVAWKNLAVKGITGRDNNVDFDETWNWLMTHGEKIKPLIRDTVTLLKEAGDKKIVFEAQLGALRDIYFGIYPFTSSSCSLASFAQTGAGVFNQGPAQVIGVIKAFSTVVGAGAFVTEMDDESQASSLRESANEYGAATGRPRRIGHFDAIASRYGAFVQGATDVALTKLDSLSGQKTLKICTGYKFNDQSITHFPLYAVLEQCKPVYVEMPGWDDAITGFRQFADLPKAAQDYVLEIERLVEKPITYVSVGPEREQMIVRR
jgi:adenylosuccinate synthase